MEVNAEKLVNEVTALLMNNGCTINQPAMYELAIYIIKREKALLNDLCGCGEMHRPVLDHRLSLGRLLQSREQDKIKEEPTHE